MGILKYERREEILVGFGALSWVLIDRNIAIIR